MSKIQSPGHFLYALIRLTRDLPERFERSRRWCPRSVLTWLLLITQPDRKTSYRRSLRLLGYYGRRYFGWSSVPSLASISTARRKLPTAMLRDVLHSLVLRMEALQPILRHAWGSRRFIAFDGARMITPRSADTARRLHRYHKPNGDRVHNPQGLLVAAVDVFRRLPLDWTFVGKGVGERTAMKELVERMPFQPGDVAIMDRGFPSKKLFAALIEHGVDIVARMSTSAVGWKEVQEFVKAGKKNGTITMTLQGSQGPVTLKARLVERDRKKGRPRKGSKPERMVILTTLSEDDGFDRTALLKIYGARWGIESLYGEMKAFMDVENFHSSFVDGCEQEIAAAMIWMALASYLQAEAETGLADGRSVVRADCLRAASDLLGDLIQGRDINQCTAEDIAFLRRFSQKTKPDRHYPRECKRPHGRSIQRGCAK